MAQHTLTFFPILIIFNNPENTKKASISEVLPLSPPHQSHIPLHISLIYWRETEAPLQASAIICSFRGPAPEVLHSVRTSNVDSILAAIRPHPLKETCLFVSPPLLSSSSLLPSVFFILPSLLRFFLSPPRSSTHLSLASHPAISSYSSSIYFTSLHSHPQLCPQGSTANCLFNNRPP